MDEESAAYLPGSNTYGGNTPLFPGQYDDPDDPSPSSTGSYGGSTTYTTRVDADPTKQKTWKALGQAGINNILDQADNAYGEMQKMNDLSQQQYDLNMLSLNRSKSREWRDKEMEEKASLAALRSAFANSGSSNALQKQASYLMNYLDSKSEDKLLSDLEEQALDSYLSLKSAQNENTQSYLKTMDSNLANLKEVLMNDASDWGNLKGYDTTSTTSGNSTTTKTVTDSNPYATSDLKAIAKYFGVWNDGEVKGSGDAWDRDALLAAMGYDNAPTALTRSTNALTDLATRTYGESSPRNGRDYAAIASTPGISSSSIMTNSSRYGR